MPLVHPRFTPYPCPNPDDDRSDDLAWIVPSTTRTPSGDTAGPTPATFGFWLAGFTPLHPHAAAGGVDSGPSSSWMVTAACAGLKTTTGGIGGGGLFG